MKRQALYLLFFLTGCLSCSRNSVPLVGITPSRSSSGAIQLSPSYVQAIRRAGGIPVILPLASSPEEAREAVSRVEGLVLSGGVDVDPAWYGEEVWNETVQVDSVRDLSDSLFARAALASGKPVLAICRGEQLFNVILGGSLYQDIPSQLPEAVAHRDTVHKIGVQGGSVLARLFGEDSLLVNSFHHQAVKGLAPALKWTAYSADGIVEAYENDQVWGVQFHPEALLLEDDAWLPLFKAFVDRL